MRLLAFPSNQGKTYDPQLLNVLAWELQPASSSPPPAGDFLILESGGKLTLEQGGDLQLEN